MTSIEPLADHQHPTVVSKVAELVGDAKTDREKLERFFYYVRDQIQFAFPKEGDLVKASQTIETGQGQCNTKGTLLLALCKAAGLPARIHFSLIKKEIQRGLFTGLGYRLMPDAISHSWVEVEIEGEWRRLDSFINDEPFYRAAKHQLQLDGWHTGYSVSCASGSSSADFNIDEEQFVQMDAVVDDHGTWDDPADYYASDLYENRPGFLKLLVYALMLGRVNRRVERLRSRCP